MIVVATVLATLAALLHVYIFTMESITWTTPRTWKTFGVASQEAAEMTKPMAYNQGFYNLFLAIGALLGLVLLWSSEPGSTLDAAGRTLVFFSLASMLAAAIVLITSGRRYLRPAVIQGTLPLLGIIALLAS